MGLEELQSMAIELPRAAGAQGQQGPRAQAESECQADKRRRHLRGQEAGAEQQSTGQQHRGHGELAVWIARGKTG